MRPATLTRVGETAFLVELAPGDAARAQALARALLSDVPRRFRQVIPGARTVLVELDFPPGAEDEHGLQAWVHAETARDAEGTAAREHEIEIVYDGADLQAVARNAAISVDRVVEIHSAATYRVAFVGFQPGFAYLAGLPPLLATPRRSTPRTRVPAGSLAIGGEWTAIYPAATPGGWNLIGRTERTLFDATAPTPSLLEPGDAVRFVPR